MHWPIILNHKQKLLKNYITKRPTNSKLGKVSKML